MTDKNNIHQKLERLESVNNQFGEPERNCFSVRNCECCGGLPGERFTVKAIRRSTRNKVGIAVMRGTYEVCPQCVYDWQ
jgi:hypothetical protein